MTLAERLTMPRPLVMDGAMGTELERRGVPTPQPLWSGAALIERPDVVADVHAAYVRAGADLLVANTFRVTRRAFDRAGRGRRAPEMARRAVEIARRAATRGTGARRQRRVYVLGSIGPLEDCFSPALVPADQALRREHSERTAWLAESGVDGLLVETMNTLREAVAATEAALATGLPVLTSFVASARGDLLDGEPFDNVAGALISLQPGAVLVNCTPLETTDRVARRLAELIRDQPFGVYANNGYPHPPTVERPGPGGHPPEPVAPVAAVGASGTVGASGAVGAIDAPEYARHAARWLAAGARLVGGCCGTAPAHIRALRALVDGDTSTWGGG